MIKRKLFILGTLSFFLLFVACKKQNNSLVNGQNREEFNNKVIYTIESAVKAIKKKVPE